MTFITKGPSSLLQGMEATFGFDVTKAIVARMKELEFLKIERVVLSWYQAGAKYVT